MTTSAKVPSASARYFWVFPMVCVLLPRSGEQKSRERVGWNRLAAGDPSVRRAEVGEPDLDERPHGFLEARLARDGEGLLVTLAHLLGSGALLQAVVACHEKPLDLRTGIVSGGHATRVTPGTMARRWFPSSPSSRCCSAPRSSPSC